MVHDKMHGMINYTQNGPVQSTHTVVFTGGTYPCPEVSESYWDSVRKPDFVIAADSGLIAAEEYRAFYGIRPDFTPDLILGDMDSIHNTDLLEAYPADRIRRFPSDKDYTDTELALDYAVRYNGRQKKLITLVGGGGGRVDHLIGIYDLFSTKLHPSVWLYGDQMLLYATKGDSFTVSGLCPSDPISIARPDGLRTGGSIVSHGLEWENQTFRKSGFPSISNRVCSKYAVTREPVIIDVIAGKFILILPLKVGIICRLQEK